MLCISIVFSATTLPPTGGKFFYSDLREGEIYGMHYIDLLVGSDNKHFQVVAASDMYNVGLISVKCSMAVCYVGDKYNSSASTTSNVKDY